MSSLNLYGKALGLGAEFVKNNSERSEKISIFSPVETHVVTTLGNWVTSLAFPLFRGFFQFLPSDPLSTKSLQRVAFSLKTASLPLARQKATNLPFLDYIHRCSIVAARIIYISSRDVETILNVPDQMVKKTDKILEYAKEKIHGPIQVKEVKETPSYFGWLKNVVYKASGNAVLWGLNGLGSQAKKIVHNSEKKLRVATLAKASEQVGKFALKNATKMAIRTSLLTLFRTTLLTTGYIAVQYGIGKDHQNLVKGLETGLKIASVAGSITGIYFWIQCLKPSMQGLYELHSDDFDHQSSPFKELPSFAYNNFYKKMVNLIQPQTGINEAELQEFNQKVQELDPNRSVQKPKSKWVLIKDAILNFFLYIFNTIKNLFRRK